MASAGNEYARKLLEKYGWEEGKGLGRCENGITRPIKPKLKFNTYGLGHHPGQEFTNDWWVSLYNSASSSISINNNEDEISIEGCKSASFNISTKDWMISREAKNKKKLKYNSFLKISTLTNSGEIPEGKQIESVMDNAIEKKREKKKKKKKNNKIKKNSIKTEKATDRKKFKVQVTAGDINTVSYKDDFTMNAIKKKKKGKRYKSANNTENDSDENESTCKQIKHHTLTDEELFRICGGRTAHHSARYEGVANGKLARIRAQDEQMMSCNY